MDRIIIFLINIICFTLNGIIQTNGILTTVSGNAEIVALSLSVVGIVSGNINALDNNNNEGGTFLFKLKSNH